MICMYLPAPGAECNYEYRVCLDNMKKKTSDGKYNNKDERLSRDLKGHNWLMNKLKVQLNTPETSSASEERSSAKTAKKMRNRRHSMPVGSAKFKLCEEEQGSQMRSARDTVFEAIDYSVKNTQKTTLEEQLPSFCDDIIYDLRKNKETFNNINDKVEELRNSSDKGSVLRTPKNQTANIINSNNDATNGLQGSASDLRKIRRTDKQSASDQLKKLAHSVDNEKQRNPVNITELIQNVREPVSIKHNLPFPVLPEREKPITIQNIAPKVNSKIDIAVQTQEVNIITNQDLEMLRFIKLHGVTKNQIWSLIDREAEINNNSVPQYQNISDTESDEESDILKNDILRKLLDQSDWNKSVISKTYDFYKKTDPNNGKIKQQAMPNTYTNTDTSKEKLRILSKVINSMLSNLNSKKITTETQTIETQTIDNEMFQVKRTKASQPTVEHTGNKNINLQNKYISIDDGSTLKHKSPTHSNQEARYQDIRQGRHRFTLDESRRGAIYANQEHQRNIQLQMVYPQEKLAEINRQFHSIYNEKTIEKSQVPRTNQLRTSSYNNQPVPYCDDPRMLGNVRPNYGAVVEPHWNIGCHEKNNQPKVASHENNAHNYRRTSSTEQIITEDIIKEQQRFQALKRQQQLWESQLSNYLNADWTQSK